MRNKLFFIYINYNIKIFKFIMIKIFSLQTVENLKFKLCPIKTGRGVKRERKAANFSWWRKQLALLFISISQS